MFAIWLENVSDWLGGSVSARLFFNLIEACKFADKLHDADAEVFPIVYQVTPSGFVDVYSYGRS